MKSRELPMGEYLLIPVGDLQYGIKACDFDRFKEVIRWGVEHGAYWIGMGDFVDFPSPSNRSRLRALIAEGSLYDGVAETLDETGEAHLAEIEKVLEPTRGRWLGMLEGHHFWQFEDGTTSDMRLAKFVGAPFLGTSAMVELRFIREKPKAGKPHAPSATRVVIWAHHGRTGGKLLTTPLTQLEHVLKGFDADVYLLGHHHKIGAVPASRMVPYFSHRRNWLQERRQYLVATGSFLRGYMVENRISGRPQGTYVERGMMNPVALGVAKIWIRAKSGAHGYGSLAISVEV